MNGYYDPNQYNRQNQSNYGGNQYSYGQNNYNQGGNPEKLYGSFYNHDSEDLKTSSFYSESYRKPKQKRSKGIVLTMIIVALISSLIGGTVVGAFFQYGTSLLGLNDQTGKTDTQNQAAGNNTQPVKQIEIVQQSESPVTAIAEKVSPSIVGISVNFKTQDFFFGVQESGSEGSGIIIRSDGYIMTNNHVIENAMVQSGSNKVAQGSQIQVVLSNRIDEPYNATVIGRDEKTDLAVLKIEASELPAVEFGDSDTLKVGELAVAIGNPAGLEYMGTVTQGIISGLNRQIPVENNQYLKLIQTDAAINPGNSGGALLNSEGKVIGVNTAKIGGNGFEGLGFAIPINTAKEVVEGLMQDGYVKGRPQIGVSIDPRLTQEIADAHGVPMGLLVADVSPLSGAYNAGIKTGDIITKFDGVEVESFDKLEEVKNGHQPGDIVKVEVYRIDPETQKGDYQTFDVQLGEDKG